jgi:hypothetical protein
MQDATIPSQLLAIGPESEWGWYWLAVVVSTPAERRFCLQHVLTLNRRNALARRALEQVGTGPVRCPLLPYALGALEHGYDGSARRILETIVRVDPGSELAWLALSVVVDANSERRYCLERVLELNPRNVLAHQALERQDTGSADSPLLTTVRTALAGGRRSEGRSILESILRVTPDAGEAWQLLAGVVDTNPERRYCLEQVVRLNPGNKAAVRELDVLGAGLAWSPLGNAVVLPEREKAQSRMPSRWLESLSASFRRE